MCYDKAQINLHDTEVSRLKRFIRKQPPGRLIVCGFLAVILAGWLLLLLPCAVKPGVELSAVDALFTSASAVCVTGLLTVDTADTYTVFGQVVVTVLIQLGGLGVSSVGVGLMVAAGRRVGFKSRQMVREALNVGSFQGIVRLVRSVLAITFGFELAGAIACFCVFIGDYPFWQAVGLSIFHSIASFNNAGFDIFGGGQSLAGYSTHVPLLLITCALIICGGIGFPVMLDLAHARAFRKLTLQTKVVLTTTLGLLAGGTLLLRLAGQDWLSAFFYSVSARTAGFSISSSPGSFSTAALLCMCVLMLIGASPGSTGGGIKTTTFFALLQSLRNAATQHRYGAFHRSIPDTVIRRAHVLTLLSLSIICTGTFVLCLLEPELSLAAALFEVFSAFGTVGLSTGITGSLCTAAKVLIMALMFTGRVGAFTIASIWYTRPERQTRYTEESITIG